MRENAKQKNAQEQASIGDMKFQENLDTLRSIAHLGAWCWTVFLWKKPGTKYYSYAFISFLLMLSLIQEVPPLSLFLPAWTVAMIFNRPDKREHSKFGGSSRLKFIFRREQLARIFEPFLVFAIGIGCIKYSVPFAQFCVFGALCLFVVLCVEQHQIDVAKRRMRDAQVEMEWQARLSRGDSGW